MSTDTYLAKLDLEQLKYARDRACALIEEKENQQKFVVWRVEDHCSLLHYFAEKDYVKAAEKLLEEAKQNAASETLSLRAKTLRLVPELVIASEYPDTGLPFPPP